MAIDRIPKESILAVIEKLGPCQPIDIRKELKLGDSFLIGALLSELVADGKLAITKVKRGGSPFYYDIQKPETIDAVSKYLNEKDRRTYALLKEQRVMREDAQDPLVRVGLQHMPDFSKPIEIDGVAYWRHFLVDEKEAERIVLGDGKRSSKKEEMKKEIVKEIVMKKEEEDIENKEESAIEKKNEKKEDLTADASKPEKPKRSRKKKSEEKATDTAAPKDAEDSAQQAEGTDAKPKEPKAPKAAKKSSKKAPAPVIMPDGAVMISPQEWLAHDTLYARVQAFAGSMPVRDARVHKPHTELTCILTLDAPFGKVDVFAHAFNRKFTADDIKALLPAARELGLPVLVLSVDPVPSKITSAFKGVPNILFKTLQK